jgi:hypothetical protein
MTLPQSQTRVYGHIRDPIGHRRTPVCRLVGSGTYPRQASLETQCPLAKDQGQTGRCVGFGKWGAIFASTSGTVNLSPTGIYRLARAVDRIPDGRGNLPPLIDEGCQPNQADRALSEWGASPWDDDLDGAEITDADLNGEPSLAELRHDSALHLVGSYTIDESAPDFEANICRSIAAGYAISFAIPDCDDGFEAYAGGVLGEPLGRTYGGHELFCFGYELAADGQIYVDGQNSWGQSWGRHGRFRGSRAFTRRWVDVQAMKVTRRAA